jgi:uncharacterized protein (TIGR00661 family)
MANRKTILVAPLNWGLGHATRCIPLIQGLLEQSFNVIIASDGAALAILQKEFPILPFVELPSYSISYPKNGAYFRWKLLLKLPAIKKTMQAEKKLIQTMVSDGLIDGIISDNRFGIRNDKIPSVFITHQLNVLSGITSVFSTRMHRSIIKQFDECWVPDVENQENLSGNLGHLKKIVPNVKYLGILSRMEPENVSKKYDILAILSGPEPQRTLFEEKILESLSGTDYTTLLVRGVVGKTQVQSKLGNISIVNFMQSKDLESAINESAIVIARSGYTTLMDLSVMGKKVFFIPTPGQYEQLYLAQRMQKLGMAPFCEQQDFSVEKLKEISKFKGLSNIKSSPDYKSLFSLFERE